MKLERLLSRAEELIIGVLLASAAATIFVNVVARYVFNLGFPWAEELVRYEIVWMAFIGGSVAARQGIHIGVDVIAKFAPPRIGRMVTLVVYALSVAFCSLFAYFGAELIVETSAFGQVSPALQVPMWTVQAAIPVGAGLMAFRFAQQFVLTLRGAGRDRHLEFIG